jgi:hypothetical protein
MKYTKAERLAHANQLIQIMASHGRRFFFDAKQQRTAHLLLTDRGHIYFVDDYTGKAIYTHETGFTNKWRGFSHGHTLRTLVEMMRDYVTKGVQIPFSYIGLERSFTVGNIWGYDEDSMQKVRAQAVSLPIIAS